MHKGIFDKNQTRHIGQTPHTNCIAGGGVMVSVLFCNHRIYLGTLQLLSWPRVYTKKVKYEAICAKSKAWYKLNHATGQWFKAQQQIYKKCLKKKRINGLVQSTKLKCCGWILWKLCMKECPQTSKTELNVAEHLKEKQAKILPQWWKILRVTRKSSRYFKLLLEVFLQARESGMF